MIKTDRVEYRCVNGHLRFSDGFGEAPTICTICGSQDLRKVEQMKHIGIIGTRRRDTAQAYSMIREKFFELYEDGDWIVSGGCPKGGDRFAEKIAKEFGIPIIIFYPNWKKHGNAAGIIRNGDIAKKSDIIIACVSGDRTGGTEDTLKKFQKLGKSEIHTV